MEPKRAALVPVLVLNFADNYWQHGALARKPEGVAQGGPSKAE